MLELKGDVFKLMESGNYDAFCVTTNGYVKKNGACVMGRGIAFECTQRFEGIELRLGQRIKKTGNHVYQLGRYEHGAIMSFPVKHKWNEKADMNLIIRSCLELERLVDARGYEKVLLPRPGCGNGKLRWVDVKAQIEPLLSDRIIVVTW